MAGRSMCRLAAARTLADMTTTKMSKGLGAALGLVALGLVPALGGVVRLNELARGTSVSPEDLRFAAHPVAVLLHVVAATLFALLGAFQFASGLRERRPSWHRRAGRIVAPAGLVAALAGLWLTFFLPPNELDGPPLAAIRLVVGTLMVVFLARGVVAIRHGDVETHQAFMTRAYALGIAAGTQVFTMMPMLLGYLRGPDGKAVLMGAAWLLNALVAEALIRARARS